MTAPNHALTGALIGLSISNPELALPLAFLSHFVCDAIPHYDPPGKNLEVRMKYSNRFDHELVWHFLICVLIIGVLALFQPKNWILAAVCAFMAASPDLFWIPRYIQVKRTGKDTKLTNPFLRFHSGIQWKTGPKFIWLEAVWFVVFSSLIATHL